MLQFDGKSSINEAGPRVLETLATPDRNEPILEIRMAFCLLPYLGLPCQFTHYAAPFQGGAA
jgi:hypothetical protein